MTNVFKLQAILFFAIALGGCEAISLSQLQGEFNSLYVKKQELKKTGDTLILMPRKQPPAVRR